MALEFLKILVFYPFLAYEGLEKSVLTIFVYYQETITLGQHAVLRDCYQKIERRQVAVVKCSIITVGLISTVLAVMSLFNYLNY